VINVPRTQPLETPIEARIIWLQSGGAEAPRRLNACPTGLSPKSAKLNSSGRCRLRWGETHRAGSALF